MPESTDGDRWSPVNCLQPPTCDASNAVSTGCAPRTSPCATWPGPSRRSPRGSPPRAAPTGTTSGTVRYRIRCSLERRGTCRRNSTYPRWTPPRRSLLGEHDFSSFCRRPKPGVGYDEPSLVRHLTSARWAAVDNDQWGSSLLRFEITASSFCHQMVRSIVGTLVDVGLGRRRADSLPATLAALDRNAAGQVAPPTGLVLWSVDYSGERWDA